MRRTFAVILSTLLVLGLFCFGVSAAEGTAIKTEADFAAMAADGVYYLDADITLTASYETAFTGTLDGNGHTLTVSAPVFATLNGTVKNLTLKGKIESTANAGALAAAGSGVTVVNVVNNADVSTNKESGYVGGLIGAMGTGKGKQDAFENSTFTDCVNNGTIHAGAKTPRLGGLVGNNAKHQFTTFTNCVNNGKIEVYQDEGCTALTGTNYTGGIVGGIFHGKFVNCLNNGDITVTITSDMGGIAGRIVPSTQEADHSTTFINCTNKGNLTNTGRASGGIAGYVGVKLTGAAFAVHTFEKCVNYGNISQIASGSQCGGIVGYIYGQNYKEGGNYQYGVFTDCVNYGTLYCRKSAADVNTPYASQIIGYTNASSTTITNCVGLGKIDSDDELRSVVVGLSSDDSTLYKISGVKLVENDGTKYFSYANDDANAKNRIAIADRPAGMVDFVSKADAEAAVKAMGAIGYADPNAPATPDTPSTPDTPDTPVTPGPSTGDAAVNYAVIAVIALLGIAGAAYVSSKKKVTDN